MIVITANVDVFENNYNDGEMGHVNWYSTDKMYDDEWSVTKAVEDFMENELYFSFMWEDAYIDDEDKGLIHYNVMVDGDNSEASQGEIDSWKEGTIKLYSSSIQLAVRMYDQLDIDLNQDRKEVVKSKITNKQIETEMSAHNVTREIAINRLENR